MAGMLRHLPLLVDLAYWLKPVRVDERKVAVFRLDAIGDFIIWLPYAKFVRQAYPGKEIVLVVNARNYELAVALPYWDRVVPVDLDRSRSDFWYRLRVVRSLRREGFSTSIHPTFSRTIYSDLLVRAARSPVRIGQSGDTANLPQKLKSRSDAWYTKLATNSSGIQAEVERAREFSEVLLERPTSLQEPHLPRLGELLPELAQKEYFVIFPGALVERRRWPIERFCAVAKWLADASGWMPVIAGGAAELEVSRQLEAGLEGRCRNLTGRTSLPELAECIRSAKLLISNETSAAHIGAAVHTPSVCIVGGGHFGRFLPYPEKAFHYGRPPYAAFDKMDCFECNWHCKFASVPGRPVPCIERVEVAEVQRLVRNALGVQ